MLKSGLALGGANAATALFSLVRNIVIARLISVEDFGIATTFAITMTLVEMSSNIGLDWLLVQSRDGEASRFQGTAHSLQLARGVVGAVVLFVVAEPLAAIFDIRDAAWAFQVLAVVPLLRGLAHLDMFRLQREMRFAPAVAADLSAQGLATVSAVPLALSLGDYRAMLYAILIQQLVFTLVSHIVAERPYRCAWDPAAARQAIGFGWPLLINGFLMFATTQGDRVIAGSLIGMAELGWFSAALILTMGPTLVIVRTFSTFFLPQLSKVQHSASDFGRLFPVVVQAAMLSGLSLAVIFTLWGSTVLTLLYGTRYEPATLFLTWIAIMQAVRIARGGLGVVSVAQARTRHPMIANVLRTAVLPAAWVAVELGGGIGTLIAFSIAGEVMAFAVSLYLLRSDLPLSMAPLVAPIAVFSGLLLWCGLESHLFEPHPLFLVVEQIALAITLLALIWTMPELRAWTKRFLSPQ